MMMKNKIILLLLPVLLCIVLPIQSFAAKTFYAGTLIKDIRLEGFVLGDKERFVKIFKPYKNKYLTADDMDNILHKIQAVYEREGYLQLVGISYKIEKYRLIFTALMTS